MQRTVHVVFGGDVVLAAYTRPYLAYRHAQCITGAVEAACVLTGDVPPARLGAVPVYVIMDTGSVLAAYMDIIDAHAACLYDGMAVVSCELLEQLPPSITADIEMEEWSDDGATPVVEVSELDDHEPWR